MKQYTTYPSKVEHTSFFTDEDGDLILPEALKIGNYRIEEVSAPFGYVVNDKYVNISVDTDTAFETDGDTNDATTMLANSEFVALLKQANTDSSKMAEVIGVSEAQLRFVTNTASGMGLIKCGSVVIPFDNQISKDTDLYRLYNTNIHEKIAEQKKKEAMLQ